MVNTNMLLESGVLSVLLLVSVGLSSAADHRIVIATWPFTKASLAAWNVLDQQSGTALDAVVAGGTQCEVDQCDTTVGYGGSPDENGVTTLDAMVMDGATFSAGAVASMHDIKDAIKVARAVMQHTKHTLLVGPAATKFAISMGFPRTNLSTVQSIKQWMEWKNGTCQPNFWKDVLPNPATSCGPYSPATVADQRLVFLTLDAEKREIAGHLNDGFNHDTIGLVAIDKFDNIAAGTSTNGAKFKIPGRVGDSPIIGSGAYADNSVGGATATGDGDLMMRFLPSFLAVELMRGGASPGNAAAEAVQRIARAFPTSSAAVIALNKSGQHGGSCHGFQQFSYTVMTAEFSQVQIVTVACNLSPGNMKLPSN